MQFRPHDRFAAEATLTKTEIAAFARGCGDTNPLHHDPAHAAQTRFGGVIASGPQTSAMMMGLTASHFGQFGEMLGLEFSFKFRAPVLAGDTLRMEWLIVRVRESSRLGGKVVELRGRLRTSDDRTAVGATGKVLVVEKL